LFTEYFANLSQPGRGHQLLEARKKIETFGYAWVFRRLLIDLGFFDYAHQVDTTGRREANLWKLVNFVEKNAREPGTSLLQLLQQGQPVSTLAGLADSGDASSPFEPNKLQLMTVHASKGLQFEHVFIPFMEKKPRVTPWLAFAEDPDWPFWSLRLPLSDPTKPTGGVLEKLIVDSLQEKELAESLRVLYVAMTRAKSRLYLSWSGTPQKQSWAEALLSVESQWRDRPEVFFQEVGAQPARAYQEAVRSVGLRAPYSDQVSRFLPTPPFKGLVPQSPSVSPSWNNLLSGQTRRREGVVLHRVFESLKHHSPETTLKLSRSWFPDRERELAAAIDFVWNQEQVPLQDIISCGFVEWGYRQRTDDGTFVEKRIDLWGVVGDTLWVVDYKTGSEAFREQAFAQMREYGQALKLHLHWERVIRLAAVYPFSQKIYVD
jgi:ATP-dependent helicase/nuclease subunit A